MKTIKINRSSFFLAVLIIVITFIVYIPAIRGGFIWDDDMYVTENPLLSAPDGLERIWFSTDVPSQYFPLTYTTFWIEHQLWGLNPSGYHTVNIFIHITNALLIWFLLCRLSIPGAWLASALFALHPVHVESVAWITERKNLLSCFFYLLALIPWLRFTDRTTPRVWRYYLLTIFLFMLALFSKTTACTLPFTLLLINWYKDERLHLRQFLYVLPFFILGLMMGLLSMWWEYNIIGTRGEEFTFTVIEKILIASRTIWFYPYKLVWPTNLTFSYPRWDIDQGDFLQYMWPLASLLFAALIWRMRQRLGKGSLAAILFYSLNISPILGVISLYTFRYTFVADHYQYVASVGLIALFAAAVSRGLEAWGTWPRFIFLPIILISLGALTLQQGHIYKNEDTLWRDTLKKNSSSWMAHNNLGNFLKNQKKYVESIYHYSKALGLKPKHTSAYSNRGISYAALGKHQKAINDFNKAIEINPSNPTYYYNRGIAYYSTANYRQAVTDLNRAITLDHKYVQAYYVLSLTYSKLGDANRANRSYNRAIEFGFKASQSMPALKK